MCVDHPLEALRHPSRFRGQDGDLFVSALRAVGTVVPLAPFTLLLAPCAATKGGLPGARGRRAILCDQSALAHGLADRQLRNPGEAGKGALR